MERFTVDQRITIVKTDYKYRESIVETVRKFRAIFIRNNGPLQITVTRLLAKFEGAGSVVDKKATH